MSTFTKTGPSPADNRHVRVFISSTFRDMHTERDLLVKEVFSERRRKCIRHFVTFTEVHMTRAHSIRELTLP